jgi:hypothetical protein
VDVVFSGHDHVDERTAPIKGVTYVVSGEAAGDYIRRAGALGRPPPFPPTTLCSCASRPTPVAGDRKSGRQGCRPLGTPPASREVTAQRRVSSQPLSFRRGRPGMGSASTSPVSRRRLSQRLMVGTETEKVTATSSLGTPRSTAASTLILRSFEYGFMTED